MGKRLLLLMLGLLGPHTVAEVPAEQAWGLYAQTNPDHLNLSPFWGMVALKSGILENIRFFGNYGSTPHKDFPLHPSLAGSPRDNCPQDAVAAVVQYLFPSPDGANFVPNERKHDPIGDLARKHGKHPEGLSKIEELLTAILEFKASLGRTPMGSGEQAAVEFEKKVRAILGPLAGNPEEGKAEHPDSPAVPFTRLLQLAVREETEDKLSRYPPGIVEVSLLAYAWKIADEVDDIYRAFGKLLRKPESKEPESKEAWPAFDESYYTAHEKAFVDNLDNATPEQLALFMYGYKAYRMRIPDLVTYKTTLFGEAKAKNKRFYPDCGETSLRNFFNIIFNKRGTIDPARLEHFCSRIKALPGKGKVAALRKYYLQFSSLSGQGTALAHHEWSNLVSNLNQPSDSPFMAITYGNGTYNLKGIGILNMLNLIAHVIPDQDLNAEWHLERHLKLKQIKTKLDRLCALASNEKEGFVLNWSVDGEARVPGLIVRVDFAINGMPAFSWYFDKGHFVLAPMAMADTQDWRQGSALRSGEPWLATWLQRFQNATTNPRPLARPYEFYGRMLENPEEAVGAVDAALALGTPILYPGISLIINRSIPYDAHALDLLASTLIKYPDFNTKGELYPIRAFQQKSQEQKDALFFSALVGHGSTALMRFLLDHGANINQPAGFHAPFLLQLFMYPFQDSGLEQMPKLIRAGADLNVRGPGGWSALHFAAALNPQYGDQELAVKYLKLLVGAGMSLEIKDDEGRTPVHTAMAEGTPEAIDAFLQAGADLHAKDRSGITPMDLLRAKSQADKDALLHRALRHCSSALMRLLMEGGASADAPINLVTPFLLHMLKGTSDTEPYPVEQISRLLQAGADPTVKDFNGLNALHYAVHSAERAPELADAYLQCLLREGLNPNVGDWNGMTPLHHAVMDGKATLVETLLRGGADIQARDARGETPLDVAQDFGLTAIVILLKQGPGEGKTTLPALEEKKTLAPTP